MATSEWRMDGEGVVLNARILGRSLSFATMHPLILHAEGHNSYCIYNESHACREVVLAVIAVKLWRNT